MLFAELKREVDELVTKIEEDKLALKILLNYKVHVFVGRSRIFMLFPLLTVPLIPLRDRRRIPERIFISRVLNFVNLLSYLWKSFIVANQVAWMLFCGLLSS